MFDPFTNLSTCHNMTMHKVVHIISWIRCGSFAKQRTCIKISSSWLMSEWGFHNLWNLVRERNLLPNHVWSCYRPVNLPQKDHARIYMNLLDDWLHKIWLHSDSFVTLTMLDWSMFRRKYWRHVTHLNFTVSDLWWQQTPIQVIAKYSRTLSSVEIRYWIYMIKTYHQELYYHT